jgi:hypothetical protein
MRVVAIPCGIPQSSAMIALQGMNFDKNHYYKLMDGAYHEV